MGELALSKLLRLLAGEARCDAFGSQRVSDSADQSACAGTNGSALELKKRSRI